LIDRYFDPEAFDAELMALPGEFAPPNGRLLLAQEGEIAAGCAALHDLGDGACEMKRMFVHTEFHGKGVGRILAECVISEAKAIGYKVMRLDTGARQREAQELYRKFGFKPIEAYYDLPDDCGNGSCLWNWTWRFKRSVYLYPRLSDLNGVVGVQSFGVHDAGERSNARILRSQIAVAAMLIGATRCHNAVKP
jgi:GNAT superfamily N-acetyltransferase